jgi:pyruvate/2-oxoglutarate dehydrogenase complex dihydrolipoamide acyltransferase (E2) component
MLKSKLTKPCFYIESKADVTDLMALRPGLSKSLGAKITSNAFLIRALALAAKKYPVVVGSLVPCDSEAKSRVKHKTNPAINCGAKYLACGSTAGSQIKIADAINVGFPVHAPQGLVVPVIKDADRKTLVEIAQLEKVLTEKSRSNSLTFEEMQGQTIGLSNLGVYGIDSFLAIPALVASTILAVGNVIRTVVPHNGEPTVCKMMSLSLAVDGIVLDEVYAAKFLNLIIEQLQNPQQLT